MNGETNTFDYCYIIHCIIVSNGNVHLDWVEIGNVLSVGNDDYNFTYGPQENVTTVWGGEQ